LEDRFPIRLNKLNREVISGCSTRNSCFSTPNINIAEAMEGDDPWFWDVGRVVLELCTPNRCWIARHNVQMPDPVTFEISLREHNISGDILLSGVTDDDLRKDLGPMKLAHRVSVKDAIAQLQCRSQEYQNWCSRIHGGNVMFPIGSFANGARVAAAANAEPYPVQGQFQAVSIHNTCPASGTHLDDASRPHSVHSTGVPSEISDILNGTHSYDSQFGIDDMFLNAETSGDSTVSKVLGSSMQGRISESIPQEEYSQVVPEVSSNPKKRKRIAPTLLTSTVDLDRDRHLPTQADMVAKYDPQNIEPGVIFLCDDGRKRLVPISSTGSYPDLINKFQNKPSQESSVPLSTLEQGGVQVLDEAELILNTVQQKQDGALSKVRGNGYLGRKKLSLDQIFYGENEIGSELLSVHRNKEFTQLPQSISSGRRLYVNGVMKRYLRSERHIFDRNGKEFSAICPYPAHLAPTNHRPSFTLFHSGSEGKVHATREDSSRWPELNIGAQPVKSGPEDDNERQARFFMPKNMIIGGFSSYNNWDPSLLEKYRYLEGGDKVLPLYGDSGDEGEFDQETWDEMEAEHGTLEKPMLRSKKRSLTALEINEAIDEGIAVILLKWTELKLPKRQNNAYKFWYKSKREGTTKKLIKEAQRVIDKLNSERLAKMRKEILGELWFSQKQVRQQTRIMEPSIFDREDLIWQISILQGNMPPQRLPSPEPRANKKRISLFSSTVEEDGESIESETDMDSSDDGLDGFVVPDQIDATALYPETDEDLLVSTEIDNFEDEAEKYHMRAAKKNHVKRTGKKMFSSVRTADLMCFQSQ